MFKETIDIEANIFTSPQYMMNKKQLKAYNSEKAWFNRFFKYVVLQIDEEIFRPLYADGKGSPNAPIRVLVGMQKIKEGLGLSDTQLEEALLFNLAVRKALGLVNLDDAAPVMSSYYRFRVCLYMYDLEHGTDLYAECFHNTAGKYLRMLDIKGNSVRMDSKLLDSNIANYTRYEIVWKTLYKSKKHGLLDGLKPKLARRLEDMLSVDPEHTEYYSDKETRCKNLDQIGRLVYDILTSLKIQDGLLHRVFHEQFNVSKGEVTAKHKKEISAQSVQNPNDIDATYRVKVDQEVKGESVNVTETVPEGNKPSMIVDVQVKNAGTADNTYTKDAIATAERVSGNHVNEFHGDGAYDSLEFREFAQRHGIAAWFTGLQGKKPRFELNLIGNSLFVKDLKTDTESIAIEIGENRWKYVWTDENGNKRTRYFSKENVDSSARRQLQATIPKEELNKRNNVEAAMFQLSFHTRNNQTRYRGLYKHNLLALNRCGWMNFVRLSNYLNKKAE